MSLQSMKTSQPDKGHLLAEVRLTTLRHSDWVRYNIVPTGGIPFAPTAHIWLFKQSHAPLKARNELIIVASK